MDKMLVFKRGLMLQGKAFNTIETYSSCLEVVFNRIGQHPGTDAIKNFLVIFKNRNTHAQYVSTIHHYFRIVLHCPLDLKDIPYPKKKKSLPKHLSVDEIRLIYKYPKNTKHQVIIALLYGCGLRISELLNLKWVDINRHEMIINVRVGKGGKDRPIIIDAGILSLLEKYYRFYEPKVYVLNGQGIKEQYSSSSINQLLKYWAKRAGIKSHISAHVLRHSYAQHLYDSGVELVKIQKLLGHGNIKTTEVYAHTSTKHLRMVKTPLEML